MHKLKNRIIAVIVVLAMMLSLTACGPFDAAGDKISNLIVNKYDKTEEFDSSKTQALSDVSSYNVNGETLYETILIEDALVEGILTEDILEEHLLYELLYEEDLAYEDIIIEDIKVEIIDNLYDLDNLFICESYYSTSLDYSFIRQRIADGVSSVMAEVVIDLGSCILDIITYNWGGLAVDAGQIVLTAGGTSLAAFIGYQVGKAKSEAAGNSYEVVMYDALNSASEAFYYTSVVCDVVNTAISTAQFVASLPELVKTVKNILKVIKTADIVNEAGNCTAKLLLNGNYNVTIKGVDGATEAVTVECKFAAGSTDLYNVKTGEYVCSFVKSGDTVVTEIKSIPSEIYSGNNLKYICEGNDIYEITVKNNGEVLRTCKGTVDQGGFVKNGFGQIIDKIDFATGKPYEGFTGISKLGNNITVDVFGNIIDLNTGAVAEIKVVDGIKVLGYSDSGKNFVKLADIYEGSDGVKYIKNVDNGRTIGRLDDAGEFVGLWKKELDAVRSEATENVRKLLVKYVKEHSDTDVRTNFPALTLEQIEYIRDTGKIPTSIEIHHCKNVANYPDLAGDITNLEVMSHEGHLAAHHGSYQNSTTAKSLDYVNLKELFGV